MTTPKLDIKQKGRWQVVDPNTGKVSQHNTDIEAVQNAGNHSAHNGGSVVYVESPYYEVTCSTFLPSAQTPPAPEPSDPTPPDILIPPDVTTKAIAHWDGVPYQDFEGTFKAGVIAHHGYGIERVEIAVNGQAPQKIYNATVNDRTGELEYWVELDATQLPDGLVWLEATAYPNKGTPHKLETLPLWANANGTEAFPEYLIKPGQKAVPRDLPCPTDRWMTVGHHPEADPDERVVFNMSTPGKIRLKDMRLTAGKGWVSLGARKPTSAVWFDGFDYRGVKSTFKGRNLADVTTMWLVGWYWRNAYYTDGVIDHVANPLNANKGLARNVHIKTAYEDAIRIDGLVTNVMVDTLTGGVPGGDWGYVHTDLFQLPNNLRNGIYQNIVGKDIRGQGMSIGGYKKKVFRDSAFVNIDVDVTIKNIGLRVMGPIENMLLQDVDVRSPLGFEIKGQPNDVVMRGKTSVPDGYTREGVEVLP